MAILIEEMFKNMFKKVDEGQISGHYGTMDVQKETHHSTEDTPHYVTDI